MAEVIELSLGEELSKFERYVMVLVGAQPSVAGAMLSANHGKRIFHTYDTPTDFTSVLARAKTWADENLIRRVYVRRSRD